MKNGRWYALALAGFLLSPAIALAEDTAPAASVTPAVTNTNAPAPVSNTMAPTTPIASNSTAPAEDPNEIVCHAGTPVVGSRIPGSRVCHTRKEWNDLQYHSGHDVYQMQENSRFANPPGQGH